MSDDILSALVDSYKEAESKNEINSQLEAGIDNITSGEKLTKDGYLNMSGGWSKEHKEQRQLQNELLKSYKEQQTAIENIRQSYGTLNKELRDITTANYLFQSDEEEKLSKFKLTNYKKLYEFVNNKDRERFRLLDEEEANIYLSALKNKRELTTDELVRIEEIQNEKLSSEEQVIRYTQQLRKNAENDIRQLSLTSGMLQFKEEKNVAQMKLTNYKELYEFVNDKDRERYNQLIEEEAEIYKIAAEGKRELYDDELKRIKEINKEKEKYDATEDKQYSKKLKKWSDGLKSALNSITKSLFDSLNKYTNFMWFDQMKAGMSDFSQAYEQNFTELAGRFGTNRQETHDAITHGLNTVNNDSTLSKALNYSSDVMPEIVVASQQGFMGEEAIEVGISKALDKKVMPWLNTQSEGWSLMQFSMDDDALNQIKGQQLLLQATREGNRILQTGIADTLLNQFAPLLASIEINTTSKEDLGEFYAVAQAQLGDNAPEAVIKETAKSMYDAVYKPFDALTKGNTIDKIRAQGYLQTGSVTGMENYVYDSVGKQMEGLGDNRVAIGSYMNMLGINAYAHTQSAVDQYTTSSEESSNFIPDDLSNKDLSELYTTAVDKATEKVTATQEHDNKIQNEYAQKILNALLKPHGSDIQIMIFDEIVSLKNWFMTSFLSNLLSNLVNKGIDKLFGGSKGGFGSGGLGGKGGSTSKVGGLSPKVAGGVAGGVAALGGAIAGYNYVANEADTRNAMHLSGKDIAKGTDAHKAYKASLEANAKAQKTGALVGGAAGVAGGAIAGAAIGSVVPGIGTAIGGVVGGAIGLVGALLGAEVGDAVSPLTTVLSDAAVESLNNLSILQTNWDEEVVSRQNLVSAMEEETNIEVQKRMLLDAGIDSNLVKMAETDKALDELAKSALRAAEDNAEMSNNSKNFAVSTNDAVVDATLEELREKVLKKGVYDGGRSEMLQQIVHLMDIDSDKKQEILDDIDESEYFGFQDDDVDDALKLIKTHANDSSMRIIAGNQKLQYDTMNTKYLDELNTAITNEDKDAADKALKLMKADKLSSGGTALDKLKADDYYKDALKDMGININAYKLGSSYIPYDMVAQLHKGERVLTAGQNKEYTKELISGNSSSIIQTSVQDIINAIQIQTRDIIKYLSSMTFNNLSFSNSTLSMLPSMGNTKVTF